MAGFVDIGQNRDAGRHQVVRLVIDFVIFDEIERLGLRDSVDMRHFVTVNDTIKLNFLFNLLKGKSLCKKIRKCQKKFLEQIQVFLTKKSSQTLSPASKSSGRKVVVINCASFFISFIICATYANYLLVISEIKSDIFVVKDTHGSSMGGVESLIDFVE